MELLIKQQDQQYQQNDSDPQSSIKQVRTLVESAGVSKMRFELIVKFFQKVAETRGKDKSKLIKMFINALFKDNRKPNYVYNVLRLILPSEDRERGNYGIREKTLAVVIRDAVGLNKSDFERLKHYKNPSYHGEDGQGVGDFPSIVFSIADKFCKKDSTLTIEEMNNILDELTMKTETKDQTLIFIELFQRCTAEEIRWLIRIILKDLKLGIKTETVLGEYHPDAQDYFNLTNSIKQVAKKFEDKSISLKSEIMLFHPIKPMLAGKKPLEYFDEQQRMYLLETKFDGQRLQVHMQQEQIKMFSRNGKDYTHIYKQLVPLLKQNVNTNACILDGEVLVLEKKSLNMVPFGMNKQVALDNTGNLDFQICYRVFDVLWVRCDGQEANLMGHPLKKRKLILQKLIKQEKGKLEIVKGELVSGRETIANRFYQSIDRSEEGIMLKDPDSLYIPNDRSINWIKLKGDYVEGLIDTLDLLIIGGYYGQASYRTGVDWTDKITTFLLGVITHEDPLNPKASHVIPFCKVGTGYSEVDLNNLRNRLRKHWTKNDGRKPLYMVGNWKPKLDDKPDCFIDYPMNSVVLQIRAAEMIKSDAFGAQKTLRFPRVVKIRYDKDWNEALKFAQLQVLMSEEYTKGMKKREKKENGDSEEEDGEEKSQSSKVTKKMKTATGRGRQKAEKDVISWFKGVEIDENAIISDLFTGLEFMILNLNNEQNKPILETKILENNGTVVQNPLSSTRYIIAEKMDFRFRNLALSHNSYTFIKPEYIDCCIGENRVVPLSPVYLTMIPKHRSEYFNTHFDLYGDSYRDLISRRELNYILSAMDSYFDESMVNEYEVDEKLLEKIGQKKQYGLGVFGIGLTMQDKANLLTRGYRLLKDLNSSVDMIVLSPEAEMKDVDLVKQFTRNHKVQVQSIESLRKTLNFSY